MRRAQLRLQGPIGQTTATDEQGRYEFTALRPGLYRLTAAKAGYLTLSFGQRRTIETPRPLDLADAQTLERIDFALPRGSVIVARVTDDLGDPIAGVRVQVERYSFGPNGRVLSSAAAGETTDRGEARIGGLPPGDYLISANAGFGRTNPTLATSDSGRRYAQPTYYPGTPSAQEAQHVSLQASQEQIISFPLVAVRAVQVSGTIRSQDGSVPQGLMLSVMQQFASSSTSNARPVQPDGSFLVTNVMPGEYSFTVRPATDPNTAPVAASEYARQSLTVGQDDVTGLTITTTKGRTIRGQMVFDSGTPPANLRPGVITIVFTGGLSQGRASWNDDWTFRIDDLAGAGMFRPMVQTGGATGWFLKSVLLDGKDVTNVPTDFSRAVEYDDLKIVLTAKRTELGGAVVDSRGASASDFTVVAFSEDRALWTPQSQAVMTARPDQQGRYRIIGLPPGRYFVAALDSVEPFQERDPSFLERLQSTADRIALTDGESRTIDLRVVTR